MTTQQLNIELSLLADAMPGSGVGTETINDLIPRDHSGHPIIRASHLKGLVRQWLIDCAAVRGYPLEPFLSGVLGHPGRSTGEEGADGIESITGFEDLKLQKPDETSAYSRQYVTRTSLNKHGTVQKNSLRTNEAIAVDSKFGGCVFSLADRNSWKDIALRLALLSFNAIGSGRNRGAGYCSIHVENESRTPGQLLKLLDAKKGEITQSAKVTRSAERPRFSQKTTWLELCFTARSPICCPEYPTSSNSNIIESGFTIPASAVQGAILTMLDRSDSAVASACFESPQFRCWPLLPVGFTPEEAHGVFPVRVPISHRMSKLPDPETQKHDFRDSVIEPYDWRTVAKGSPLKGSDGVLLRKGNTVELFRSGDMPRIWSAHGVHNGLATASDRNLYQVTSLAPMVFKGILACPEDVAGQIVETLNNQYVAFGRSRSVRGGGTLTVKAIPSIEVHFSWRISPSLDRRVFVLQSPVAVPDEMTPFGAAEEQLKSLIPATVEEFIQLDGITAPGIQASARVLFGWNRHGKGSKADRRHNRLRARRVITPGSVFVLQEPVSDLATFLLNGIGDGKQQGLGNILPHPGKASIQYKRQQDKLPIIKSKDAAGKLGIKLHEMAPAVSPSQIGHLGALAERESDSAALEFLERQTKQRSGRTFDRWKDVKSELVNLLKHPKEAAAAFRVWQDLAIGDRMEDKRGKA